MGSGRSGGEGRRGEMRSLRRRRRRRQARRRRDHLFDDDDDFDDSDDSYDYDEEEQFSDGEEGGRRGGGGGHAGGADTASETDGEEGRRRRRRRTRRRRRRVEEEEAQDAEDDHQDDSDGGSHGGGGDNDDENGTGADNDADNDTDNDNNGGGGDGGGNDGGSEGDTGDDGGGEGEGEGEGEGDGEGEDRSGDGNGDGDGAGAGEEAAGSEPASNGGNAAEVAPGAPAAAPGSPASSDAANRDDGGGSGAPGGESRDDGANVAGDDDDLTDATSGGDAREVFYAPQPDASSDGSGSDNGDNGDGEGGGGGGNGESSGANGGNGGSQAGGADTNQAADAGGGNTAPDGNGSGDESSSSDDSNVSDNIFSDNDNRYSRLGSIRSLLRGSAYHMLRRGIKLQQRSALFAPEELHKIQAVLTSGLAHAGAKDPVGIVLHAQAYHSLGRLSADTRFPHRDPVVACDMYQKGLAFLDRAGGPSLAEKSKPVKFLYGAINHDMTVTLLAGISATKAGDRPARVQRAVQYLREALDANSFESKPLLWRQLNALLSETLVMQADVSDAAADEVLTKGAENETDPMLDQARIRRKRATPTLHPEPKPDPKPCNPRVSLYDAYSHANALTFVSSRDKEPIPWAATMHRMSLIILRCLDSALDDERYAVTAAVRRNKNHGSFHFSKVIELLRAALTVPEVRASKRHTPGSAGMLPQAHIPVPSKAGSSSKSHVSTGHGSSNSASGNFSPHPPLPAAFLVSEGPGVVDIGTGPTQGVSASADGSGQRSTSKPTSNSRAKPPRAPLKLGDINGAAWCNITLTLARAYMGRASADDPYVATGTPRPRSVKERVQDARTATRLITRDILAHISCARDVVVWSRARRTLIEAEGLVIALRQLESPEVATQSKSALGQVAPGSGGTSYGADHSSSVLLAPQVRPQVAGKTFSSVNPGSTNSAVTIAHFRT